MTEFSTLTYQSDATHDITYICGQSSLGGFLTAVDGEGVCAILLGDDCAQLLRELQAAFPGDRIGSDDGSGPCHSVAVAVASLIEQPAEPFVYPTSVRGGDFEQMLYAALRQTSRARR